MLVIGVVTLVVAIVVVARFGVRFIVGIIVRVRLGPILTFEIEEGRGWLADGSLPFMRTGRSGERGGEARSSGVLGSSDSSSVARHDDCELKA